jgi:hypothetical protein
MVYAARSRSVACSEVMMLIAQYPQNTQAHPISTTFVLIKIRIIIMGAGLATYLFLNMQSLVECIRYALFRAINSFPNISE